MKEITRKRVKTVQAKDGAEFDQQFNDVSNKLPTSAELHWDGPLCVHFLYSITEKIPETVKDEFELAGDIHFCEECPHLEMDGDKRKTWHPCRYAAGGRSRKDSRACNIFYQELMRGEIGHEDH